MIGQRYEIPSMHIDFYRDHYRKMLRLIFINMLIILLLVMAIMYVLLFEPTQKFYITTTDGRIIPMIANR